MYDIVDLHGMGMTRAVTGTHKDNLLMCMRLNELSFLRSGEIEDVRLMNIKLISVKRVGP